MIGWEVALTAVITAAVTWSIAQRQITAHHVLKERRKWREEIRAKALLVHDAILCGNSEKLSRLKAELMARLNPLDEEDEALLACMVAGSESKSKEFAERVALLLKHDWEMAKLEASTFRRLWLRDVKRMPWRRWKCRKRRTGPKWLNSAKAWFARIRWIGPILVLLATVGTAFAPSLVNHMTQFCTLIAW